MSGIFVVLLLFSVGATLITQISLVISFFTKKDIKKKFKRMIVLIACSLVFATLLTNSIKSNPAQDSGNSDNLEKETETPSDYTSNTNENSEVSLIIVDSDTFVAELENDIEKAAEKYNGKKVEISGTVNSISDGGIMYGYYVHSERDAKGIRVVCWVDSEKPLLKVGDEATFVGYVREVSASSITEIGMCEITSPEIDVSSTDEKPQGYFVEENCVVEGELLDEVKAAFIEIGEDPEKISSIEYVDSHSSGYIFTQRHYKVEFKRIGWEHNRWYMLTTQEYYDGEPEKNEYPDEFLTTIKFWVGDDGHSTNILQWSHTGNGKLQQ